MWEAFSYGQKPYKVGWAELGHGGRGRGTSMWDLGSSHMPFVPGLSRK